MNILADALRQGIAPAIVVAIYLIITKIIDSRKESIQIKLNTDLTQSINNISSFIVGLTKNIIDKDKEKCRNAIEDSFKSLSNELMRFFIETITNNHIDINKENILSNISNICYSNFYTIKSKLYIYKFGDDVSVSELMKTEWINELEQDIVASMYNNLDKDHKIFSYSNRLNISIDKYITYLINHISG